MTSTKRRAMAGASQQASKAKEELAASAEVSHAEMAKPAADVFAALSAPFVSHPTVDLGGVADGE